MQTRTSTQFGPGREPRTSLNPYLSPWKSNQKSNQNPEIFSSHRFKSTINNLKLEKSMCLCIGHDQKKEWNFLDFTSETRAYPLSKRKSGLGTVVGSRFWIWTKFKASTNHCCSDFISFEPKLVGAEWFSENRNNLNLASLADEWKRQSYSNIICSRSSSLVTELRASRSS